jgi:hypothetical protein
MNSRRKGGVAAGPTLDYKIAIPSYRAGRNELEMNLSLVARTALRHFGARRIGPVVRGLSGGCIGFRVDFEDGSARWLRLQWLKRNAVNRFNWNGYPAASILVSIPLMPKIFGWHDWNDENNSYRAILTEFIDWPVIQPDDPVPLPESWWQSLIKGLESLSLLQTKRRRVDAASLTNVISQEYGPIPISPINRWITAHGDLHWGNLTAPELRILDWEAWGVAPEGFDISRLMYFSLDHERLRAELLCRFEHVICTSDFANSLLFQFAARRRGKRLFGRDLRLSSVAEELESYLLNWAKTRARDHGIGPYLIGRLGSVFGAYVGAFEAFGAYVVGTV